MQLKHWQVFLILILCGFLKEFEWEWGQLLTAILSSMGFMVYAAWSIIVGQRLYHYFPGLARMNYKAFAICAILWMSTLLISQFISVLYNLTYIEILTIPGAILALFPMFYCLVFASRMIESVESGRAVDILESTGVLLLIIVLPIGIWFLQPMINKSTKTTLKEPAPSRLSWRKGVRMKMAVWLEFTTTTAPAMEKSRIAAVASFLISKRGRFFPLKNTFLAFITGMNSGHKPA